MSRFHRSRFCKVIAIFLVMGMLLYVRPEMAPAHPSPTTVTVQFAYDSEGNLTSRTDANNETTYFYYDEMNRLVEIDYPGGSDPDVSFTYDANGNRTGMIDRTGTTTYAYDFFDRLTKIEYPDDGFVMYGYDEVGNVTDLTYGNYQAYYLYGIYTHLEYQYDEDNRITTVIDVFTGETTTYTYDEAGNLASRTLPNGTQTQYSYDTSGRLTGVDHQGTVSYGYELNAIGNRTRVDETVSGSGAESTYYQYDEMDRLEQAQYPDGRTVTYQYDTFGNRTQMTETTGENTTVTDYYYDTDSRLLYTEVDSIQEEDFYYDATGNLIQRSRASDERQIGYAYDDENRLVRYYDGTNNVEYVYNGMGERVARIVNGQWTRYLNDPNRTYVQVLAETDQEGIPKTVFHWGNELIDREDHNWGGQHQSDRHYYLRDSINGNIRRLSDSGGAVVNQYTYDAFGEVTAQVPGVANDYQFHGEVQEQETGLVFLRARYYDPSIGRFLTRDPVSGDLKDPQKLNSYVFVQNSPVNSIDPSGLTAQDSIDPWWTKLWESYAYESVVPGPYGQPVSEWNTEGSIGKWGDLFKYTERASDAWKWSERISYGIAVAATVTAAALIATEAATAIRIELHGTHGHSLPHLQAIKGPGWGTTLWRFPPHAMFLSVNQSRLPGGVMLNRTAEVLLDINKISGAKYDPDTGMLVIYGEQDTSLPTFDIDDLAVAVHAAEYGWTPVVSIDPPTHACENYPGRNCYSVRYGPFGNEHLAANTYFGFVMFEADRMMKSLGVAKDSITQAPLYPNVPGYKTITTRGLEYAMQGGGGNNCPPWWGKWGQRFWLTPDEIQINPSPDGLSMEFATVKMKVMTETRFVSGGAIFDPQPFEDFANHLTEHYDEFAQQYPIFEELKRMAYLVGITKWIKENEIPVDFSVLEEHSPSYYEDTPWETPSITDSKRCIGKNFSIWTFDLEGGVDYCGDFDLEDVQSTSGDLILLARPEEMSLSWTANVGGTDYRVAAISLEKKIKDGAYNRTDTDLTTRVHGDIPLAFNRYYDSFDVSSGSLGWGWSTVPYELKFKDKKEKYTLCSLQWEGYGEIWYVDKPAGAAYRYVPAGLYDRQLDIYGIVDRFAPDRDILFYEYEHEWVPGLLLSDLETNMIMRLANGVLLDFDMEGNLEFIEDRNGNRIEYSYQDGRLTRIGQTASGREITLTYNGEGRIQTANAPGGRSVVYSYDGESNLTSAQVNPPSGREIRYSYDEYHNLIEVQNVNGESLASRQYDVYGRVTSVQQPGVATPMTKDYSLSQRTTDIQGPEGLSQGMEFDENYNPIRSVDAYGNVTDLAYNKFQELIEVKNAQGDTTKFFYDWRGDRLATLKSNGRADVTYVDLNGNTTASFHSSVEIGFENHFDQDHHKIQDTIINAYYIDRTEYEYDTAGNLTEVIRTRNDMPGGEVSYKFGYDGLGNRIWSEDGRGYRTTYTYDSYSRLERTENALAHWVEHDYNSRDHLIQTRTAAGTVDFTYNDLELLENVTHGDPGDRHTTHFTYNVNDQLETVTDPAGSVTSYQYDQRRNLSSITHEGTVLFEYDYDDMNRLVEIRYTGTAGGAHAAVIPPSQIGGQEFEGDILIEWEVVGDCSGSGDLMIEYSTDGTNWNLIATVDCSDGSYLWNTGNLLSETVWVRFLRPADPDFRIAESPVFKVRNENMYFVNDADQTDDMYCTAIGQPSNSGLSPASPMDSIQAIIDSYDLPPGSILFVDTGTYNITSDIEITEEEGGLVDGFVVPVTIMGSDRGQGTLIEYNSPVPSSACIKAYDTVTSDENLLTGIVIRNVRVKGATYGIVLSNCYYCGIFNSECFENGLDGESGQEGLGVGIFLGGGAWNLIEGNMCHHNGADGGAGIGVGMNGGPGRGAGIVVNSSLESKIKGNVCYSNGGIGGVAGSSNDYPGYSEGIGIFLETTNPEAPADGNDIIENKCYDNDVYGRDSGFAFSMGIRLLETENSRVEMLCEVASYVA